MFRVPSGWYLAAEDESSVRLEHPASRVTLAILRRNALRRPKLPLHVDGTVENKLRGAAAFRGTVAEFARSLPNVATSPGPDTQLLGRQTNSTTIRRSTTSPVAGQCTAAAPCPTLFVVSPSAELYALDDTGRDDVVVEPAETGLVVLIGFNRESAAKDWESVVVPLLKTVETV